MFFVTLYFIPFGKVKCVQRVTCNSLLWYEDAPKLPLWLQFSVNWFTHVAWQKCLLIIIQYKVMSVLTSLTFFTEVHSLEFTRAISVEYNVECREVNTWRILVLHVCVILNEYSKTMENSSSPCCLPVTVYHRPFQMFVYVIRCTFILKKMRWT